MPGSVETNFLFTLGEVFRLIRVYADKEAARYGITRAQWAVLTKVERNEGLKQTELAEQLDIQPITLTRLIDKLCDSGWIERRGDENDRRVNRLYLKKAAHPCSASSPASAPNSRRLRSRASIPLMRIACSANSNRSRKTFAMPSKAQPATPPERNSAMAETVLKLAPEQKSNPETPAPEQITRKPRRSLMTRLRRRRRTLLLVVLPIVAVIGGVVFYLNGGRYVGTDDAYVGAQKVLITPEISGKIDKIVVREGQHVKKGDELFEIDPVPFRLAVAQAKAALDQTRTTYDNLVDNIKINTKMLEFAQQSIELKKRDVERKSTLAKQNFGSQLDLDNAANAQVTAESLAQYIRQQISNARTQLLGNVDLPIEQFPPYAQAKAKLDDAQRNLDHTVLRAPMDGVATQVDQIQLGRFVAAGSPVFSVIDVDNPWVDANPKESDFTYVAVGQPVTLDVDAFPNHVFKGTVGSLSPGTGAQFAILPPQNATGNFVKVVQRVPVRIYFDKDDPFVKKLKAGMSVYATIDTNHRRTLAGLLGLAPASAQQD